MQCLRTRGRSDVEKDVLAYFASSNDVTRLQVLLVHPVVPCEESSRSGKNDRAQGRGEGHIVLCRRPDRPDQVAHILRSVRCLRMRYANWLSADELRIAAAD